MATLFQGEIEMKRIMALACAVAVIGAAGGAGAITRTGRDAAVGAVGGAVVAGPVGAVVGGVGGAVVGSRASHRAHYRRHHRRHVTH
jgi:hypothetical protein